MKEHEYQCPFKEVSFISKLFTLHKILIWYYAFTLLYSGIYKVSESIIKATFSPEIGEPSLKNRGH